MKERMKRFLSVLLTIAMVLAISLPVMAEEEETTQAENTYEIPTVQVYVTDDAKAEIYLYRIIKLMNTVDSDDPETVINQASSVEWISTELRAKVQEYAESHTFVSGTLALDENPALLKSLSDAEADVFYQWLAGVIETDTYDEETGIGSLYKCVKVPADGNPNTSGTTKTFSFSNVQSGGYLALAANGVNVYHPTSVNLLPKTELNTVDWNIITNFNMKVSKPTIEKTVTDVTDGLEPYDSATVAIGDSLSYDIYTDVPEYSDDYDKNAIRYTMVDIYSTAFTYVTSSGITITGYDADGVETEISSDYYTSSTSGQVYVDSNGNVLFISTNTGSDTFYWPDGRIMSGVKNLNGAVSAYNEANEGSELTSSTVTVSDKQKAIIVDFSGKFSKIAAYEKIGFHYSVTVNDTIEAGAETNSNTATLAYTTNPISPEDTSSVDTTVKVYTYGMDVTKMDGATSAGLNGVKFDLYKKIDEMTEAEYDELVKNDTENVYKSVAIEGSEEVAVYERIQDGLSTGTVTSEDGEEEDGKLIVGGLDVGVYLLVETETLMQYNILEAPVSFTIKQDTDNLINANKETSAYVALTVKNYQGVTLPSTGGMGITMFVIIGMGLAGAAIIMLRMQRRKIYR